MKRIYVPVFGGLGNQMFQLAFSIALKHCHGRSPVLVDATGYARTRRAWELAVFGVEGRRSVGLSLGLRVASVLSRPFPASSVVLRDSGNPDLSARSIAVSRAAIGYWQSPAYFSCCEELVRSTLQFPDPPTPRPVPCRSHIAVHIRRGDYVSNSATRAAHLVCTDDWYASAMELARETVPNALFHVYTDDVPWARSHFRHAKDVCVSSDYPSGPTWHDMAHMARFHHFVISNSTYSWWASYLGARSGSHVWAPRHWYPGVRTVDVGLYRPSFTLV